ncbi:hypothetical protein C3432_01915 [Citrobacter amalonaticus]|uniref:SpaN/EivJ family type III secretion system needle length determinant n=1 Tax=Citrobacter amalonaticus TaxID=35703 RepID=UPI000CDCFE9B|nr:hypothetical protein [Citrobacter amalonaticus]POT59503.1 hypothetical protein C3432_01915 [Citrobacter amalonaticus]POT77633.1 hypothetical protein C3436_09585 [Citrobacter amalonaticus]POV07689.1 hypothetical protein C3424_03130 [Citrobacter amalonaticus]
MSLAERCGNKLKKDQHAQEDEDIVAGGLGLASLPSMQPVSERMQQAVQGKLLTTPAMSLNSDSVITATRIKQAEGTTDSSKLTEIVAASAVAAKANALASERASAQNLATPAAELQGESRESDMKIPEAEGNTFGQLFSDRDKAGILQTIPAINNHDGTLRRETPFTQAMLQGQPTVDGNSPAENVMNNGDISRSEMTWHFKSWGDNNTHTAKLVFHDVMSSTNEVTIIPSNETVHSALTRQQQQDGLSYVQIERATSQDQEQGQNSQQNNDEEESE